MTALVLGLLLWAAPGAAQPDARLLAEVSQRLGEEDFAGVLAVLDAAGPDGSHPALLRLRAEAYVGLLDYPAAAAALEGAPATPDNLALRARLLAILSRDDEARAVVSALLEQDGPLSGASRVELAAQLRESGLVPEVAPRPGSSGPRGVGSGGPGTRPAAPRRGRLRGRPAAPRGRPRGAAPAGRGGPRVRSRARAPRTARRSDSLAPPGRRGIAARRGRAVPARPVARSGPGARARRRGAAPPFGLRGKPAPRAPP